MSDTEECSDILELGLGISLSSSSSPKQKQLHPNPNLSCKQFFPQFPQDIEIGETSASTSHRTEISNGEEENSTSYLLPHDLQMAIAEGFPVKSLLRFLSVSKLWKFTIRSKDFMDAYLIKSLTLPQRQGLLFTFSFGDKCFVFSSPRPENYDETSSSSVATYNMTYESRLQTIIAPSVHGLICYGPASGLVIYNPCTRRSIVLPKINSGNKRINHYIGYDPIDNCYKVVCVISGRPQMGNNLGLAEELGVLTMGNEQSWRMVEDVPSHSPTCYEMCINGVLYYGAFIGTKLNEPVIMSFDVRSEKFDLIKGPDNARVNFLSSSKLTSYEGKLAVLFFEDQVIGTIALWVLEDAVNAEWSYKSFNLPSLVGWTTDLELQLFSATDAGEVILAPLFVHASTYRVVYYDPKNDSFRKIEIEGITDREVTHEGEDWWYCRAVSVFPGQVESLMFL